ncbi:DivIVA domain-containing protein, partial [Streptomyces sp.]|uniref:DivIVA domain-containing protein n=1 Tax=Streptomyces sp. TaxID=1931 RepID=UPI002F937454
MKRPHDFAVVRAVRGYRPDQVDRFLSGLSDERDAARERARRLTVLAKEREAEAARLREAAAGLTPQRYATLGERARQILELGEAEAELLVTAATEAARL